jgi:hypothetical protein
MVLPRRRKIAMNEARELTIDELDAVSGGMDCQMERAGNAKTGPPSLAAFALAISVSRIDTWPNNWRFRSGRPTV